MRKKVIEYFHDCSNSLLKESVPHRALVAIYLFDFLDRLRQENFPSDWFERMKQEMGEVNKLASILATHFDNTPDIDNA